MSPDLLILGQSTIDHVVPAEPGPWAPRPGGNALYAAAGARLWLAPHRIAVVTRAAGDFPFAHDRMLGPTGIAWQIAEADGEHLVEWLIYETDGSRRALPRNPGLRAASETDQAYLERLLAISPAIDDVPEPWRSPGHLYAAPQLLTRHAALQEAAAAGTWIGIDPSPHYAASASANELRRLLPRADALLLSEADGRTILSMAGDDPEAAARSLLEAGFGEVVLKLGPRGAIVADAGGVQRLPPPHSEVCDQTGAGDAFGGAYAAARAIGCTPVEAARRGTIAAGMVIATEGAEAALHLDPQVAWHRLADAAPP